MTPGIIARGSLLVYNERKPFKACGRWSAMSPSIGADHSLEHLVFEIAKGVAGKTGAAYFHSLARHLTLALDADYVLIGELQPDGERIATLAVLWPGW